MSLVRAFVLGAAATAVLAYVFCGAVALVVAAGGGGARLAVGSLQIFEVSHSADGSAIALGSGLLVLAFVGGLLNALVGYVLRRRS